jgi:protein disulfide-isomerase
MKKIVFGLLAGLVAFSLAAAEGEWLTDLAKAKAKAKEEKKLVLLDFTGSDWCPPCKALHKNVLTSKEFSDFAKDNLVLVEVDFPRSKKQSAELKKANKALQEQFSVTGYPTIVVLDPDGKELSKNVGYSGASSAEYVANLKKEIKK